MTLAMTRASMPKRSMIQMITSSLRNIFVVRLESEIGKAVNDFRVCGRGLWWPWQIDQQVSLLDYTTQWNACQ